MLSLLEAALSYAARGWDVFPVHGVHKGRCTCGRYDCSSPGKHPLTSRGLHDATTNATVIAAWWRQWRRANVAIATGKASGMVVVDLDFPDALGSLDALIDGPCPLRVTLTALTGGGGVHLYYRWERELGNAAGKLPGCEREVPGVDLRADGGYQSTDEHFVRFVRGGEDPKSQRTELRNHTGRLPGHPEPLPGVDLRGEGG